MTASVRRSVRTRPGFLFAVLLGVSIAVTQYSVQLSRLVDMADASFASTPGVSTGYQLDEVTAADGAKLVARWNPAQTAITYEVNLARIPAAKRAATLAEVKTGFGRLAAADGMTYRYRGATAFVPDRANLSGEPAEIVVAAAEATDTNLTFGDSTLGVGGIVWTSWSGADGDGAAIVRGYVVLSPSGLARLEPGFGRGLTQGNLILHELGHATGLQHAGRSDELMHATLSASSPDGYARGDLDGLARLGAAAGPISIPAGAGLEDLS